MQHRFSILAVLLPLWSGIPALAQTPPILPAQFHPPAPFSNLGPLAGRISPGQSGAWTVRDENGRLVLANPSGDGAIRFYVTDWQGDLAVGRSVSVRVAADGQGGLSAAGILFRVQDGDPRWLAFVETAQGKVALYARHPNELKQTISADIPGGHLVEGDMLTLNQRGDTAQLLVNGLLVTELKTESGDSPNIPAPVGIIAMDTGTFDFSTFAFGKLVTPLPPPTSTAANVGNVPSLGGLARNVSLGEDSGWTASIENGQLVYAYPAADLAYYYRSVRWPGPAAEGRSATLTVDARADSPNSAAGLGFGISEDGGRIYALAVVGNGKISLIKFANNNLEELAAFDPPELQPGGGRHVLTVSQTSDEIALYADGKKLGSLTGKTAQDAEGDVGLVTLSKGRYAFQDFVFGPATRRP